MALKLVTAPNEEPVSLAEIKEFLRIDGSDEDSLLSSFIKAATRRAEKFTGRVFITQTWDLWLDEFPYKKMYMGTGAYHDGVIEAPISISLEAKRFIEIGKPPLQSVTYLKTFNESDSEETFSSDNYFVDSESEPGRVSLRQSSQWPSRILRSVNGIQIRFVAGYGSASAVPEDIKTAIKMIALFLYENRGCSDDSSNKMPFGASELLQPYQIMRL